MNEKSHPELEAVKLQVEHLKGEINAFCAAKPDKPLYKDPATLIALLALMFSFVSFLVSEFQSHSQDLENQKTELRTDLQKLTDLPKERVEAAGKFNGNPEAAAYVDGLFVQTNSILASRALEIAKKLPSGSISAIEYFSIATALQASFQIEDAKRFLDLGKKYANDCNTELAIVRQIAVMLYYTGKVTDGRKAFQEARDIFEKYPGYDTITQTTTNIMTELQWARAEANVPSHGEVTEHLKNADGLFATLPASPNTVLLRGLIQRAKQDLHTATTAAASDVLPGAGSLFNGSRVDGVWQGAPSGLPPIVFHITQSGASTAENTSSATANVSVRGNQVNVSVPQWALVFNGTVNGPAMSGTLTVNGSTVPLTLTNSGASAAGNSGITR